MLSPGRFTFPSPQKPADIWVDALGFYAQRREVVTSPYGINGWRIMLFHDAQKVTVQHVSFQIQPQTLFVIPSHVQSEYGMDGQTWRHSWLRLSGKAVEQIVFSSRVAAGQPILFQTSEASDFWLNAIYREMCYAGNVDVFCLRSLIQLWLRKIEQQSRPGHISQRIPEEFRQIHRHIMANYAKEIYLRGLADKIHVSPRYFCTQFKKYYGVTPVRLVLSLRLAHARELLSDTDLPVSHVARLCGFGDIYYFSKIFRRHAGQSPLQYRRTS